MDIRREFTTLMRVPEKPPHHRNRSPENLHWDMPPAPHDAQHHPYREYHAKGRYHREYVDPEDAVQWVRGNDATLGDFIAMVVVGGYEGAGKEYCW